MEAGDLLSRFPILNAYFLPEPERDIDHQWQGRKCHQGQHPVEREHEHRNEKDAKHVAQDGHDSGRKDVA